MGLLLTFCKWLDHTFVGTAIRESLWLFPIIETLHIFGIISLVGATSILDLRLMGLTFRDEPVSKLKLPLDRGMMQRISNFTLNDVSTGRSVMLYGFQFKKAIVLVFLANDCPVLALSWPQCVWSSR